MEELEALRKEQADLRDRLADAEKRAAVAEAVANERERIIQTQATALRMLEAGAPAPRPVDDMMDNNADEVIPENVSELENRSETPPAPANETPERPGHRWSTLRRLLNR